MKDAWGTTPSPRGRHDRPAAQGVRTYYERAGVRITDRYVSIDGRRYSIAELSELRTVRGPHDPLTLGASGVAAVLFCVIVIGRSMFGPAAWIGAAAIALIPAALAVAVSKTRKRRYELWAAYHGVDVQVLAIPDAEVYGQICRALIRAREAATLRHPGDGSRVARTSPAY